MDLAYIDDMAHKPIAVANEFIRLHGADGSIDHLKLQKLVYFAQGWWLAMKGSELVAERPQVWRYGPVFESLYRIFSPLGRQNINTPRGAGPFANNVVPTLEGDDCAEERACVEWVWSEYGNLDGPKLSDLTHAVGTPWRKIADKKKYRVPLNTEIPKEADWDYFAGLAKERGTDPTPIYA